MTLGGYFVQNSFWIELMEQKEKMKKKMFRVVFNISDQIRQKIHSKSNRHG